MAPCCLSPSHDSMSLQTRTLHCAKIGAVGCICLRLHNQTGSQTMHAIHVQVKPCVLHGDLWSGNIASADGQPAIFDPAVYYGHHEVLNWGCHACNDTHLR